MSDEQTQNDFLGEIAAEATGTTGIADDVSTDDAVPNDLADQVESYDAHAERRDEHLHDDADQGADDLQVDDRQDNGRKQSVPLGALQKERAARQQAQAQLAQMQQQLAAFQQQQLQAQQTAQQAQQQAEIPAFVDDPEGHINGLKQQFQAELEAMRQGQQHVQQEAQFRQQVAEVAQHTVQSEAQFRALQPDYDQAVAHMSELARAQVRQAHPSASDLEIQQVEATALLQFALQCRQQGLNPAEALYQRAVAHGFQASHRRTQSTRKAPTSLSDTNGTTRAPDQRGNVRAKDIAGMSNEEFDQLFESMRNAERPRFGF
ncbi:MULTISPECIES: hypothetical protein [Pseudomonas]|jgi:hypothetical protein|uniref:hypothetical protein n=2 Tax=Pseudomonas TaxID=286 RepID=UPI0018D9B17E|nr:MULTISPECIES: hypothetical protein [Pseudomonas]MBH3373405.1 hypothetical protein [Pseudomonas juntendi]MBS6039455.1 hypothetical protein [Pseudomonas sp.]CAH0646790.1 hypothetical protein PSNVIR_01040 [Pseudomonas sp. Nvir]